ncbi:hypothetical protein SK803_37180 [Lentzea sp. BCCO 10_0856]|uniref:Secreted protein n=1 Tax=Lentzea miocenica TaxID=3095431 RepID=A0ABU4TCF7_9PSEU|nr:hypothetical protein [Lentzea sp. BCCO 10_0856]MDX8035864.1 hypothetical protein [Lentzea sp. BCCO 10_0856]
MAGALECRLAFVFDIALSLCANVAAASELSVFAVAVAASPPLALHVAADLLNHALRRHRAETANETNNQTSETAVRVVRFAVAPDDSHMPAEQRMWGVLRHRAAEGAHADRRIAGPVSVSCAGVVQVLRLHWGRSTGWAA